MLASTIRARKLMEASESGSVQLLKEKKQVKGSKNDLLESIGGVSGQDMVFDNIKEVYEQLHTSCLDGSMLLTSVHFEKRSQPQVLQKYRKTLQ